ncbi:MAG: carbon-nitrogen hydrolase family protein [Caldiserica bacterium]|nr:MAG: carbon-nitrogen hydrolase family protein [Caldisericota bacterium]
MKEFVACAIQMYIVPNNVKENTERAVHFIEEAKKFHNPDLIVFQETVTTGFCPGISFEELYKIIDTIPGKQIKSVLKAAKRNKVYIVWPTYEKDEKEKKIYNTAVLISPSGEIIGKYRKTHLFGDESIFKGGWVTPGKEIPVFETEFANIGIMICYDGDFPEVARTLVKKGAEVIVRPSAFLRNFEIWSLTNRARAFDNHVFIVAANATGVDASGKHYFGHSMIVAPSSNLLALAGAGEDIISARLSPDRFREVYQGSRAERVFDHMEDLNKEII